MFLQTQVLFWAACALLFYTYLGYPLLVRVWAAMRRRCSRGPAITPTLSIVTVAHNEAPLIRRRIENLLALDYPRVLREIVVASDGSSDETVALAQAYGAAGVRVFAFPEQRGKPAVLNEVVPQLTGELVVFVDVRQRIDRGALRALAAAFADPGVGGAGGELMLEEAGSPVGAGLGFYWRYEKFIRRCESRIDSTVGTSGALYAIRRRLFQPIPPATVLDDVLIPMQVVRQGYRVVFEPGARAYDQAPPTAEAEFTRKVRTIAGNFQLLAREPWLLLPGANRLWFQTLSHKGLRLLGPLWLALAFGCSLLLQEQTFFRLALVLQLAGYTAALAGGTRGRVGKLGLVKLCHTFCLLNWATVLGFCRFVRGRQQVTWQKAARFH